MSEALLAVLVFLPAALVYLLKSNAAMAFLALCGGFSVITLSGSDIEHIFGKTRITSLTSNDIDLILLLAPLLLTLLFTFRAVPSGRARIIHLLPALGAGALLAIVAGPMLSSITNSDVSRLSTWRDLQNAQSWIVGAGLLISLLLIWAGGFTHAKSHSKKHK
jgi:hypothetical protein